MFTETEIIAVGVIGFGLAIAIAIRASFVKEHRIEEVKTSDDSRENLENRVSPFIEIHQSLMEDVDKPTRNGSVNQLKKKIESFKHRNRFYQN